MVQFHRQGEASGHGKMNGLIVMSRNSPLPAPGEPSRIRSSAQARLAATRQNDAFCLYICLHRYDGRIAFFRGLAHFPKDPVL